MKNRFVITGKSFTVVALGALLASCSSVGPSEEATGSVSEALKSPRTDVEISTSASADHTVASMALAEPMLFVAGNFQKITGSNGVDQARSDFAVVNVYTDEIMPLKADTNQGGRLYAVAVDTSLDLVAIGGCFTSITTTKTTSKTNLAVLQISTGKLVTSWASIGDSTHCVKALAFSPDSSRLYVGGAFTGKLAAYNTSTGAVITSFKPNVDTSSTTEVRALKADPNTGGMFVGGSFNSICGDTNRHKLAAVKADGSCGAAFRNANGGYIAADEVLALDANWTGTALYAATGGAANRVIAYNGSSHAWAWDGFQTMGDAQTVSFYSDKVYWGFHEGLTSSTDGFRLARLNAADGSLDTAWDKPKFPDNFFGVWSVLVNSTAGVMAVGGDFHQVNTSTRRHLTLFNM